MANENDYGDVMPRRVMTLFLLIDCSGSMQIQGNIGKVNSAVEEMIPLLQEISRDNSDAEIKVAVLSFSDSANWVTNGAQSLENFRWTDMTAYGPTAMGSAFTELESKLSRNEFLRSATGSYAPAIILLTDGQPTDDWRLGLNTLKKNNWFRLATRIAIGVGQGADAASTAILNEFTDNPDAVLSINGSGDKLKELLCRLAVVTSTIQSRSSSVSDTGSDYGAARDRAAQAVKETLGGQEGGFGASTGGFEGGSGLGGGQTGGSSGSGSNPWDVDDW